MLTCILDLVVISQEPFTAVYYWHTATVSPPLTIFPQWALASTFNCPLGIAFPDSGAVFSFSCSLSPRVFLSSALRSPASTATTGSEPSICCDFPVSASSLALTEEPESYTQLATIKHFKTSMLKIELPARLSGSRLPSQHLAKMGLLSVWGQPELHGIQTRLCQTAYLPPKFDLLISLRLFFFYLLSHPNYGCNILPVSKSAPLTLHIQSTSKLSVNKFKVSLISPLFSDFIVVMCLSVWRVCTLQCMPMHKCMRVCVCVRGQFSPPLLAYWELTSGHQVWQQMHHLTSSQLHWFLYPSRFYSTI